VGGRHTYDRVLPGAPKGSFATLLSPFQCHAAFGTIPYTLASVEQSPIVVIGCYPLCNKDAQSWILEGSVSNKIISLRL
jgi:hypothetical protein